MQVDQSLVTDRSTVAHSTEEDFDSAQGPRESRLRNDAFLRAQSQKRFKRDVIDAVIRIETDRYTDYPDDPGGPTKFGIIQRTLEGWRSKHPGESMPAHVKDLTRDQAYRIYEDLYFKDTNIEKILDPEIAQLMFDSAVLHGAPSAAIWLRNAINSELPVDQQLEPSQTLGPKTRTIINRWMLNGEAEKLRRIYDKIIEARKDWINDTERTYRARIERDNVNLPQDRQKDPQHPHTRGWMTRARSFERNRPDTMQSY